MNIKKVFFISIIISCLSLFAKDLNEIDVKSLHKSILNNTFKGVILDVRTPMEQKQSGTIKNAIIKNAFDKDIENYVKSLDKSKQYIVYCGSGPRSLKVVKLMKKYGINGANLKGGITSWKKSKYPLFKRK